MDCGLKLIINDLRNKIDSLEKKQLKSEQEITELHKEMYKLKNSTNIYKRNPYNE